MSITLKLQIITHVLNVLDTVMVHGNKPIYYRPFVVFCTLLQYKLCYTSELFSRHNHPRTQSAGWSTHAECAFDPTGCATNFTVNVTWAQSTCTLTKFFPYWFSSTSYALDGNNEHTRKYNTGVTLNSIILATLINLKTSIFYSTRNTVTVLLVHSPSLFNKYNNNEYQVNILLI